MKIIKGTSISKGIAFGYIHFQNVHLPDIEKQFILDSEMEIKRFTNACADTMNLLQTLYEKTIHIAGEDDAKIFSIQQMMLHDSDYVNSTIRAIGEESICAEYAVYKTAKRFIKFFLGMDNEMMRSKSADIIDISYHILKYLMTGQSFIEIPKISDAIVVSNRFIPSQVIGLGIASVNALVVINGMKKSHASFLARKLEIPSVINIPESDDSLNGKYAAVDGFRGEIIIEPDEQTIASLKARQARYTRIKKAMNNVVSKRVISDINKKVKLIALDLDGTIISNSTNISDKCINSIIEADKQGITVAICTGRVMGEIPEKIRNIENIKYFITSGGSSIVAGGGRALYSDTIETETVDSILKILSGYDCLIDLYIDGNGYMQSSDLEKLEHFNVNDGFDEILRTARNYTDDIIEYYNANKPKLEKINLFFADKKDRNEAIYRISQLSPAPKIAYSMEYNLEITSSTSCKGQALQYLSRILGADMSEVMAMGDSNNDISMLKLAGVSVAMGNASESVRHAAKYITDTCENNGAAKAIEIYALKQTV